MRVVSILWVWEYLPFADSLQKSFFNLCRHLAIIPNGPAKSELVGMVGTGNYVKSSLLLSDQHLISSFCHPVDL